MRRASRRAAELAPRDAGVQERLGDLYRSQNEPARALASYEKALALDPDRFALMVRVAELALASADTARADGLFSAVLRGSADDELLSRAFHALLELRAPAGRLGALEQELLAVSQAHPERMAAGHALLELYGVLVRKLAPDCGASAGSDASSSDVSELRAIGLRGAKPLLAALNAHDEAEARAAVEILACVRNPAAVLPLVSFASTDPAGHDAGLRLRALAAAAELAGPSLLPRFASLAHGPEARVRELATFAIARQEGVAAHAMLRDLSASDSPNVRMQALLGLGRVGNPDDGTLLRNALVADRNPTVRAAAALALGLVGAREATPALLEAAHSADAGLARLSWLGLAALDDATLAPELASLSFSSDRLRREIGAAALLGLGRGARLTVTIPTPLEPTTVDQVVRAALTALRAAGHASMERFLPELLGAARAGLHGDATARAAVLRALHEAGNEAGNDTSPPPLAPVCSQLLMQLAPDLAALAAVPDRELHGLVARVLGRIPDDSARRVVGQLLVDADPAVRAAALAALTTQSARSRAFDASILAVPLAQLALADPAFAVRLQAVQLLRHAPDETTTRSLARVLARDAFALVREAAAVALADRAAPCSATSLQAALRGDDEPIVREAAARALVRLGGQALIEARATPALAPSLRRILSAN